jgi:hypothetical protein
MRVLKLSNLHVSGSTGSVLVTRHVSFCCDSFKSVLFIGDILSICLQLFEHLGVVFRVTALV